jgi:hypothetical protein
MTRAQSMRETEGSDSGYNGRASLAVRHRTDLEQVAKAAGKHDGAASWQERREAGKGAEKKPVKP